MDIAIPILLAISLFCTFRTLKIINHEAVRFKNPGLVYGLLSYTIHIVVLGLYAWTLVPEAVV
jgi:hypothetical protein